MNVLLLAAGYGTRLRPFTNNLPKCLVPINNKPLLDYWINIVVKLKVNRIFINTHYLSNKVDDFISTNKHISIIETLYEENLQGTAGTLLKNINLFLAQDDLLLIHADNFCEDDLSGLLKAHKSRPKECLMTMMTFETETPFNCGIVKLNKDKVVEKYYEKINEQNGNIANAAIYILSKDALIWLYEFNNNALDFSIDILNKLEGKIYTYHTSKFFLDIGSPENYYKANNFFKI